MGWGRASSLGEHMCVCGGAVCMGFQFGGMFDIKCVSSQVHFLSHLPLSLKCSVPSLLRLSITSLLAGKRGTGRGSKPPGWELWAPLDSDASCMKSHPLPLCMKGSRSLKWMQSGKGWDFAWLGLELHNSDVGVEAHRPALPATERLQYRVFCTVP